MLRPGSLPPHNGKSGSDRLPPSSRRHCLTRRPGNRLLSYRLSAPSSNIATEPARTDGYYSASRFIRHPRRAARPGFAAMHMLTTVILHGGRFAEGYCLANDYDQSQGRVFTACKRIVEASPVLRREARITADKIEFPQLSGATITAIASDYQGSAGSDPTISNFDELWGSCRRDLAGYGMNMCHHQRGR